MLKIRKAHIDDAEFFYNLRFSEDVLKVSLTKLKPSMQDHVKWFRAKLDSKDVIMLIATDDDKDIGYLRYDCKDDQAEISIALVPEVRGKSLGQELLKTGETWMKQNTKIRIISAKVLVENHASLKMFLSQNYFEKYIQLEKVIR